MSNTTNSQIPATLIPGDGIGPEITDAVVSVLATLGAPFSWDIKQGGLAGIQTHGDPLPGATLDSIGSRPAFSRDGRWLAYSTTGGLMLRDARSGRSALIAANRVEL